MKTFIQIMVLFFCFVGFSQTESKLKQKLKTAASPEARSAVYLELAQDLNYSNVTSVVDYAQKAVELSNNDKQIRADALQIIGNCYILTGNYKKAIVTFEKLKITYQNDLPDNHTGLIKAIASLGSIASEQNLFHKALLYDLEALKIADKHNDRKMLAALYNNIGVVYRSTDQTDKAKNSFEKSLKLQIETGNNQAGVTLTNLAAIEIDKDNFKQAMQLLQKAKPYLSKLGDARTWGEWCNNFGNYYLITNQFKEAENYLLLALNYFNNIEDQFGSANTHLFLATLYKEQQIIDKAIFHAQKALVLGESLDILDHKQKANLILSELFESQGKLEQSYLYMCNKKTV
jgi:tetratricopeptide (TPR) repeat protein